jgi:DnaD/phage-associated family protein
VTFAGFPARPEATAVPNVFFTDVLPQLGDATELAVTLFAFRALMRKRGFPRYLTIDELTGDAALCAFIENAAGPAGRGPGDEAAPAIGRALGRAVEVGVLLALAVERDGTRHELYFLNAPADRRGLEAVRTGAVDVGRVLRDTPAARAARPSAFALYESVIGTLSPPVAEELTEAERLYPYEWIEAAFREAAAQNARSWRYVARILERWAIEGPDHATTERDPAADRYFKGKYGRILRERLRG